MATNAQACDLNQPCGNVASVVYGDAGMSGNLTGENLEVLHSFRLLPFIFISSAKKCPFGCCSPWFRSPGHRWHKALHVHLSDCGLFSAALGTFSLVLLFV